MIKIEVKACEHGLCRCMAAKIEKEIMPEAHAQGFKEGYESILENMEMITDAVAKLAKAGKDHKPMVMTLIRRLNAMCQVQSDGTVEVNPEAYKLAN
jgi:hypothetical protein